MTTVMIRVDMDPKDIPVLVREWLNADPAMVTIDTTQKPIQARLTYVKERD